MKNIKPSLIVIGLCLAGIVLIFIATIKIIDGFEDNKCDMTYMYEYPKYIQVNLKNKLSKKFPRYNLYMYGEGEYAEELRNSKPAGIPVLFIPGNAGSHRQVRSLASVALRKAETKSYHFNYFTVDFDDDLGGLFGGVLVEQANFVHNCLQHILTMYKGNQNAPDSVVIIGHSMGGLIARSLYSLEGFQSRLVHLIITLGTPHIAPVVPLDPGLTSFYNKVNNFWESNPAVNNVTIVSFSGGSRDILVPVKLSSLHQVSSVVLHHSAVATAIPHVWLTIDHLALCWCKQLVLVINRALFEMIDKEISGQVIKTRYFKSQVLKKHFGYLRDKSVLSSSEMLKKAQTLSLGIYHNQTFLDVGQRHLLDVSQIILIPTSPHKDDIHFVALTKSVANIKIFSCRKVENGTCIDLKDLSLQTLPTFHGTAEFIHVSADKLDQSSHIVVSASKPKLTSRLFVQFATTSSSNKLFTNLSFFTSSQIFLYANSIFTNISLPMVRNNFDVFLIRVVKTNCKNRKSCVFGGRIYVPWYDEDVYAKFVYPHKFEILLKIHTPKPMGVIELPYLHIWNSDNCSLEVEVQYQFVQTMGHILVCGVDIPKWMYFWIVVIMTIQIAEMSNNGNWLDIWSSIMSKKMLKMVPFFALIANEALTTFLEIILGQHAINILPYIFLNNVWPYDWLLPKLLIILSAFEVVVFLHFFLKLFTSLFAWFLGCCSSKPQQQQNEERFYVHLILDCLLGSTILCLSFLCSSIALYFLTAILFINTCKKAKEVKILGKSTSSLQISLGNQFQFSETLLLLLVIVSIQTTPTFLSWLKAVRFSWSLSSDPFFPLVLLLTPTIICSLQLDLKKNPKNVSWIILLIWCVGFLLLSLDKLPVFVGIILLILDFFVFCKHEEHLKTY